MAAPVVVVGGTLAGMAVAARLSKAGHPVELYEAGSHLGGRWAAYELGDTGVLVDDAPGVIDFPAPWRDLFRKSGRPLEAELARTGHALVPAEPLRVRFADGQELELPTDRGDQYAALSRAYGPAVAARWRDLLDRLDDIWQMLRPLGLERELPRTPLPAGVRSSLLAKRTVAELSDGVDHPHLRALIRSTAWLQGSPPERTPAFVAVALSVLRTFGRWRIDAPAGTDSGRSSVLTQTLAARLSTRRVTIGLDTPVTGVSWPGGSEGPGLGPGGRLNRPSAQVRTETGEHPAGAVVLTTHPWTSATLLSRRDRHPSDWSRLRLRPAGAPAISHEFLDHRSAEPRSGPGAHLQLTAAGVPTLDYFRAVDGATLRSRHDYTELRRDPASGLAWAGFPSWRRRPPVTAGRPGLWTAGPFSPGGGGASPTLLSAALAAGGVHDWLSQGQHRSPADEDA